MRHLGRRPRSLVLAQYQYCSCTVTQMTKSEWTTTAGGKYSQNFSEKCLRLWPCSATYHASFLASWPMLSAAGPPCNHSGTTSMLCGATALFRLNLALTGLIVFFLMALNSLRLSRDIHAVARFSRICAVIFCTRLANMMPSSPASAFWIGMTLIS